MLWANPEKVDTLVQNYRGPLSTDFSWDMLDRKTLAVFAREIMLCNQIHDRTIMPILGSRWNMAAMTAVAIDEWMGASPVYNARNRDLHNIQGDGVDVIMKGFQLDIGAPHMWLEFHYDVKSHDLGYFWLTSCGAYNHVRALTGGDPATETQICVHMEDPTFDATVMAVNRGARCTPIFRPPHGDTIPPEGPCRWQVTIEDRIGAVQTNEFTEIVRKTRAGQFQFSRTNITDDGLADYSGPFKRDFRLEDLASSTLLAQTKEFALDVHLLQRACYLSITQRFGSETVADLISEHWAAMAPLYQARSRRLFGIEGDDMNAILKLLQLDHHFVPEYLRTSVELVSPLQGIFRIHDCAALAEGEAGGVLTTLLAGDASGLSQVVAAVNPRARATRLPQDSKAELAFDILIDPEVEPIQPSPYAELAGMNGLNELDLTEHTYRYQD